MCSFSRSASSGCSTDSASSRSAVTGVRSRCDRSPTVARSAASSSVIRSARRFSASPSSCGLRRAVGLRAGGELALAQPVGHIGEVGDRTADPAGDHQGGPQRDDEHDRAEQPDDRPRLLDPHVELVRPKAGPHHDGPVGGEHRDVDPGAPGVDHGEGLARLRSLDLGILRQTGHVGAQLCLPVGHQDGRDGGPAVGDVADEGPQLIPVGQSSEQDRDVARLLVLGRERPVVGHGPHQQTQRDDEREDDR